MKTGIRQKLMLGLSGMLVIVAVIGILAIRQIDDLGSSLAVVLKQNYMSVVACRDMEDAIESIDRLLLASFLGEEQSAGTQAAADEGKFNDALDRELHNITLPGEASRAQRIGRLSAELFRLLPDAFDQRKVIAERRRLYSTRVVPLISEIKGLSLEIHEMNQENMISEKNAARRLSVSANWRVVAIGLCSVVIALFLSWQIRRWVLEPLRNLIETTEEISRGNLDVVLQTSVNDEVGQLSRSFNKMLIALRQNRKSDMASLSESRRMTDEVFSALPLPVAVIDAAGEVRLSTGTADTMFGLKPGVSTGALPYGWMRELVGRAMVTRQPAWLEKRGYVQQFIGSREHFFQPLAVPLLPDGGEVPVGVPGVILVLTDVTQVHDQKEMKRGLVSTVSHQLRTPMTSLRMSVHMLLDEETGVLNDHQTELLLGAREDCERLVEMLDDLLDLNRIESGKASLSLKPVQPALLVQDSVSLFVNDALDKKVALHEAVAEALPDVLADPDGVRHIFANLFSNALRFTMPGGRVTVGAVQEGDFVRFFVGDTGAGIASEHKEHLFEQFYRVPGQDVRSGAGLGLSIVKELVEAQGGTVSLKSTPGVGSEFSFTLPQYHPFRSDAAG
jgi:signal transduction histidine kinase